MEYQYRLTKRECFSFVITYMWKSRQIWKGILRLIILWYILMVVGVHVKTSMMGFWVILCTIFCVAVLPVHFIYVDYRAVKKKMATYDTRVRLEADRMVLSGLETIGIPLADIARKWESKSLLILLQEEPWNQDIYILIPQRVFGDTEDKKKFLENLTKVPGPEPEGSAKQEPVMQMSFYVNPQGVSHMMASLAIWGEHQKSKQNTGWKRVLFWLMACLFTWCFFGTIQAVIVGICLALALRSTGKSSQNTSAQKGPVGLGHYEIELYSDQIVITRQGKKRYWSLQGLSSLVQVGDLYFLCYGNNSYMCCIPQCVFASERDEAKFVAYCQEHGMQVEKQETNLGNLSPEEYLTEYEPVLPDVEKLRKAARKKWIIAGIVVAAVVGFYAFVFSGMDEFAYEEDVWAEDYIYEPEEYPDYISLEQQVEILESLEITVPKRTLDEMKQRIEESRQGQIYVEAYPFHEILCNLAYPEYDRETRELIAFSDEAYWFDWESYDVIAGYMDILNAVEVMSQGELVIDDITVNDEQVDWDKGSGTIATHFTCNGQSYEISVTMRHDWLNDYFIRDLNSILKQVGVEKRVYYFHDNGQGAVLFYRDKDWAKQFEKLTHIELRVR